jgi:hypothetical protein
MNTAKNSLKKKLLAMSLLLATVHYHCRTAPPADAGTATGDRARCDSL